VQRSRTGGAVERQGAWAGAAARRGAAAGIGTGGRGRPDPSNPWRGPLATVRPGAVGAGDAPYLAQRADRQPLSAGAGLSQVVGASPAPRAEPRCRGGVQKNFSRRLAEIAERDAPGKPVEIWFQDEARIGQK